MERPFVLEDITLPGFLQCMLSKHGISSTLVVCSTREAFMEQLLASLAQPGTEEQGNLQSLLSHPSLRLLSSSQTLEVAFCPEMSHLRAYLAARAARKATVDTANGRLETGIFAILNPISLHRPTSAFSAQGFNRTFASAVEAAHGLQQQLIVAECKGVPNAAVRTEHDDEREHFDESEEPVASANPWDEEVSILNVSTKSFGAGERGWVGRTVKIRQVAERWCVFQQARDDATRR